MPERRHGIHLCSKRVFIMDDCKELMPEYFRFVKGVVDASDLNLNVSREILQQDRLVLNIQKWAIIFITSFGGAGVIAGTLGLMFSGGTAGTLGENPFRAAISASWLLIILFLVLGILGFVSQLRINQDYDLVPPEDRW